MPDWIEFHDSTLKAVTQVEDGIEMGLDAYVHCWSQADGVWLGAGWIKPVKIVMANAQTLPSVRLPADIFDGFLTMSGGRLDNLVPLPFDVSGQIELSLNLARAQVIHIVGSAIGLEVIGEGRYVEDLPADMKPTGG